MKATIRIDAFSDRGTLQGHVKSVATVAAKQDWNSSDVKVYQTMVAIDESLEGLKPDMSAEVTIHVEGTGENVLTVPVQAVIGGAEMGPKRTVFVMGPDGPQQRDVLLGLSNDRMVEVKEGLKEGDVVVLNPRALLGERAKTRQAAEERGGGGGGEGKGKGKGRGGKGRSGGFPKDGPPDGFMPGGPGMGPGGRGGPGPGPNGRLSK
jgi:hypothetical protein